MATLQDIFIELWEAHILPCLTIRDAVSLRRSSVTLARLSVPAFTHWTRQIITRLREYVEGETIPRGYLRQHWYPVRHGIWLQLKARLALVEGYLAVSPVYAVDAIICMAAVPLAKAFLAFNHDDATTARRTATATYIKAPRCRPLSPEPPSLFLYTGERDHHFVCPYSRSAAQNVYCQIEIIATSWKLLQDDLHRLVYSHRHPTADGVKKMVHDFFFHLVVEFPWAILVETAHGVQSGLLFPRVDPIILGGDALQDIQDIITPGETPLTPLSIKPAAATDGDNG